MLSIMLEYNPLLPINIQKTSDVSKSDIQRIENNITTLQGDVAKRVENAGGVSKILALTQAQYNAITTKDANTMYIIID